MTLGGADLSYAMGDPLNAYGKRMKVEIKGGFADLFLDYDENFNIFRVSQNRLANN